MAFNSVRQQPTFTTHGPYVEGDQLVSTRRLPDATRAYFPFEFFNRVQSRCFDTVYHTDSNFVLSAPTASGKTALLELAICRAAFSHGRHKTTFKIVYVAPTKALCTERCKDWQRKFGRVLNVAEVTGDQWKLAQRETIQKANIIVTTPDKWEKVTSKTRDNKTLLESVRLVMVDEVHFLKDPQGASLETVVARMKMSGKDMRFIVVSATVPNPEDLARWLGRNNHNQRMPALIEIFGEEFRPVPLQKIVIGVPSANLNEFQVDEAMNEKVAESIQKYAHRKPIMIFCWTRASTVKIAQALAEWHMNLPLNHYWDGPGKHEKLLSISNSHLRHCMTAGVAYLHAGLDANTRRYIQDLFTEGIISIICCTSTLAVGVNLPCHLVIVKNTVFYQDGNSKELSKFEIMQMLGRAGRPQFDDSAVAVILTRQEKVERYKQLTSGEEVLESGFLTSFIEHMNTEITLGTIKNLETARDWVTSTFFYVRLLRQSTFYNIQPESLGRNAEETATNLCKTNLNLLESHEMITKGAKFKSTGIGMAMSRYHVMFRTMRQILAMDPKSRTSEILSVLCMATEFGLINLRSKECDFLKTLNQSKEIRFPIRVNIALGPHKVSLIIQAALGGHSGSPEEHLGQHLGQIYQAERSVIFNNVGRLIRCLIDCHLERNDAVTVRNGLALSRSLAAKAWDDSPMQMAQIDGIGPAYVRKLANANIKSLEDLENTDSQEIEMALSRNPPFGTELLEKLEEFPRLRVMVKVIGRSHSQPEPETGSIRVDVQAEVGFLNPQVPEYFRGMQVVVCLLAEISDGRVAFFCKLSAQAMGKQRTHRFTADLRATQVISCYVACDDIAGTLKEASTDPGIHSRAFEFVLIDADGFAIPHLPASGNANAGHELFRPQGNKRIAQSTGPHVDKSSQMGDFDNEGITDADLEDVADSDFVDIEQLLPSGTELEKPKAPAKETQASAKPAHLKSSSDPGPSVTKKPRQRKESDEYKYACNHSCPDKQACKHTCCKVGVKRPTRLGHSKILGTELNAPNQGPAGPLATGGVYMEHGAWTPPSSPSETLSSAESETGQEETSTGQPLYPLFDANEEGPREQAPEAIDQIDPAAFAAMLGVPYPLADPAIERGLTPDTNERENLADEAISDSANAWFEENFGDIIDFE